jgi:ribosomal protein L11 methylase PrmA
LSSTAHSLGDHAVNKRCSQILQNIDQTANYLLDVGCGNEIYDLSHANLARQVLGISINKRALRDAAQNKQACAREIIKHI